MKPKHWRLGVAGLGTVGAGLLKFLAEHPDFAPAGGRVEVVQYSTRQYAYLDRGEQSRPVKDLPPVRFQTAGGGAVTLPASSLTVVQWAGPRP